MSEEAGPKLPDAMLQMSSHFSSSLPAPHKLISDNRQLESNPGISDNASANASVPVEGMDSMVAKCLTNSSNTNNCMRISPDGKTLAIHRVSRYDHNLQCAIEDFREILQRNGPDYVSLRTQPGVFDAVLTAVTGASVQSECACFSRPEPTHCLRGEHEPPQSGLGANGKLRCLVEDPETQLAFYRMSPSSGLT
ncbi:hypothetical protein U0070_023155, partial [Myodes glareolus]